MRVDFLGPAEEELQDAITYYNGESEGLGYEFAAEVKRTLARIIEYPTAWAQLSKILGAAEPTVFLLASYIKSEKKLSSLSRLCTFIGSPGHGGIVSVPKTFENQRIG